MPEAKNIIDKIVLEYEGKTITDWVELKPNYYQRDYQLGANRVTVFVFERMVLLYTPKTVFQKGYYYLVQKLPYSIGQFLE